MTEIGTTTEHKLQRVEGSETDRKLCQAVCTCGLRTGFWSSESVRAVFDAHVHREGAPRAITPWFQGD